MSQRLYKFGVKENLIQQEECKPFSWPIAAWKCIIPEAVNPKINILEKFVLSLIAKGLVNSKNDIMEVLTSNLSINKNLAENVLNNCLSKYVDKRFRELKLNEEAMALMSDIISAEKSMRSPDNMKTVYLLQDLVANTVIPCFNVDELPSEYCICEDNDFIKVIYDGANKGKRPTTAALNNAIRQWDRIRHEIESDDINPDNSINVEVAPETDKYFDEDFGIEVEMDREAPRTMAAAEAEKVNYYNITIFDDTPTIINALGYFSYNPGKSKEIEIFSPLGEGYDNWFKRIINRIRTNNEDFNAELQFFAEEKRAELVDVAPLDNTQIQLFNELPLICNDSRFANLKETIVDLSKDLEQILSGKDESRHFIGDMRKAVEAVFKTAVDMNDYCDTVYDALRNYRDRFHIYQQKIEQVVLGKKLKSDISRLYKSKGIYKNLEQVFVHDNDIWHAHTKDLIALIILFAGEKRNSNAMRFLEGEQDVFINAFQLTELGHSESHVGKNYAGQTLSINDAERYYAMYEHIVRAVYSYLIKEQIHG